MGMTGSSLQFALLNTTTIENLSRKTIVWSLAVHMPRFPQTPPTFRTISYSSDGVIRTFAILHTKPGENPFDLGSYENFKTVMGDHWYDWLFPFTHSPCANHDREGGQFAMGPVVQRMRRDAGIALQEGSSEKGHRRRRRRRRRQPQDDAGKSGQAEAEQSKTTNEKVDPEVGHDMNQIDLESGLAHTNGPGTLI